MTGIHRRQFIGQVLSAFPAYALLAEFATARAAANRPSARWIAAQDDIARALAGGEISPAEWRVEVARLTLAVDLPQLLAEIDGAESRYAGRALPSYPMKRMIRFRDGAGARRELRYATAWFGFAPDNVVTPHAHRHMVSAHLVVEGAFRVRNYDRVRDEAGAIVIRPSLDTTIGVGEVSTISPDRDNIHWFVPRGGRAATFDVIVSGLDAGRPDYDIAAVDPVRGEPLADGTIRAPIIGFAEASRFYTPDV